MDELYLECFRVRGLITQQTIKRAIHNEKLLAMESTIQKQYSSIYEIDIFIHPQWVPLAQ